MRIFTGLFTTQDDTKHWSAYFGDTLHLMSFIVSPIYVLSEVLSEISVFSRINALCILNKHLCPDLDIDNFPNSLCCGKLIKYIYIFYVVCYFIIYRLPIVMESKLLLFKTYEKPRVDR